MNSLDWLFDLDWPTILYGVASAFIVSLLAWWRGGIQSVWSASRRRSALKRYRRSLGNELSNLPIIGRKEGFDLQRAYVQLSIARSDLMNHEKEDSRPSRVFVLVGDLSAGKSTYVKKEVINQIGRDSASPVFFIRLRDFVKKVTI